MSAFPDLRLAALRRFAAAISVLNLAGYALLGFEPAYAHPAVALATAYGLELALETLEARSLGYRPRFLGGGIGGFVDFLLPAHITGLAVSMLIYTNARLAPVAFAVAVAIGSKYLLRVPVGSGRRHFLNPSNTGIAVTLLLFPWIAITPPYQFSENIAGAADWLLPCVFIGLGTFLNAKLTKKLPLILGWLGGFAVQAALRAWLYDTPLAAGLAPMSGIAFLLFTFYMVTDPATTPVRPRAQLAFGAGVAAAYGVLMALHIVFGLFFALFAVCWVRGAWLYGLALRARFATQDNAAPVPPALGKTQVLP